MAPNKSQIVQVADEPQVIVKLWEYIEKAANDAIEESGVFRIGLSGGSVIKFLATGGRDSTTDWSKWKLFFCDERFVEFDDAESTFGQYKKEFIPNTDLKESQFVKIDKTLELKECAKAYEREIYRDFGIQDLDSKTIPKFDLLLLGVGPDGHTCSLFPGHPLLKTEDVFIAPIADSPKPPPSRVTMTYTLIKHSKACIFPISGGGKADIMKQIFVDQKPLPAGLVELVDGKLTWILDEAAAALL
ncbi:6-phosphogluconolactonase [Pseudolycoriella hygida]|uniref:6-phosphogluconolactonase n=1 Tax=Pseudolycoriella hygida TaxID=35572 RepID=A0A9Q0S7T1_9DIPT|nr:6-phosphogluconolactonase [Pseudolycoriella hygida]